MFKIRGNSIIGEAVLPQLNCLSWYLKKLNNGNFNLTEFDQIRNASGFNAFVMIATKWVRETNAIGIKPSRKRIIQ